MTKGNHNLIALFALNTSMNVFCLNINEMYKKMDCIKMNLVKTVSLSLSCVDHD